jgi:outer membrane protein assembly factor BamB
LEIVHMTSSGWKLAQFIGYVLILANAAMADDWPQWRGPNRDGVSQEKGLLKQWPADGPKLAWQVNNVGGGFSTPAVVGDRIFLLGNDGLSDESVHALKLSDGAMAWSTRLGKVGEPNQQPSYPGCRSTPTVDGDLLYALGSDGDLACLESATGKVRWKKSLRTDFGGKPGKWAYAESPLVDGDALVCTPGGTSAAIVSLNKKTGEVIWKSPIGDDAAYASITITESGGVKQYVQFMANALVGVDAKTGKLLWRSETTAKTPANIPTPISHDNYVYSAASMSGAGLVKLNDNQGKFTAEEIYFDNKLPTAIGGAVLLGDYLYGTGTLLMCVDFKTGKIKWKNRSVAPASVQYADGNLYLHGENGDVALVEASSDGYHEKGHFTPPGMPEHGTAKAWAYPVVANGKLFIRDMNVLWCYEVK